MELINWWLRRSRLRTRIHPDLCTSDAIYNLSVWFGRTFRGYPCYFEADKLGLLIRLVYKVVIDSEYVCVREVTEELLNTQAHDIHGFAMRELFESHIKHTQYGL